MEILSVHFIHLIDLINQEQLQKNATVGPLVGIRHVALCECDSSAAL
jgi:hypothetical protein